MSCVNESPHLPYRIPAVPTEGQRLLARWKSLSRTMKLGIVGGGLLSLVAGAAMAGPLVAFSEPLKHLPFGGGFEVPGSSARVTSKATDPGHQASTAQPAPTGPSRPAATTIPAAPTTGPTQATTPAAEPAKASTSPLPTTPKPSTTTTTPKTTTTTSATAKPIVTPNAVCTVAGATGVSSTGTAMVCRTTVTDPQLRWRVVV